MQIIDISFQTVYANGLQITLALPGLNEADINTLFATSGPPCVAYHNRRRYYGIIGADSEEVTIEIIIAHPTWPHSRLWLGLTFRFQVVISY